MVHWCMSAETIENDSQGPRRQIQIKRYIRNVFFLVIYLNITNATTYNYHELLKRHNSIALRRLCSVMTCGRHLKRSVRSKLWFCSRGLALIATMSLPSPFPTSNNISCGVSLVKLKPVELNGCDMDMIDCGIRLYRARSGFNWNHCVNIKFAHFTHRRVYLCQELVSSSQCFAASYI